MLFGVFELAASYFRGACRPAIIGAAAFHFRVRDGNGWFRRAMATRLPAGDWVLPVRPACLETLADCCFFIVWLRRDRAA